MPGDILRLSQLGRGGDGGILQVEVRDATKDGTMHRAVSHPPNNHHQQ